MAVRTIKPYGRSIVVKDADGKNKRKISIGSRARDTTQEKYDTNKDTIKDISEFFKTDPEFFLSQWASLLDKTFKKPNTDSKYRPDPLVYHARDKAGSAFYQYWEGNNLIPKNIDVEKFKEKWWQKVHPYGQVDITTTWYEVFAREQLDKCNWHDIADSINEHLTKAQKKLNGQSYSKGYLERRADSIRKNAKNYFEDNGLLSALKAGQLSNNEQNYIQALSENTPDWEQQKRKYQLKELVKTLTKKEKNTKGRLRRQGAMPLLHQHYKHVFKVAESEPEQVLTVSEAKAQEKDLWQYHCMIEQALHFRYQKHYSKQQRNKFLPKLCTENLQKLALSIQENRQLAFAIRLGKVIHYHGGSQGGLKQALPENLTNIIGSKWWQSEWQTRIKQNESFVRQWLGAIAIANTSLGNLLDPNDEIDINNKDFLTDNAFNEAIKNITETQLLQIKVDNTVKLLFGAGHKLYDSNDSDQRINFLTDLRNALAQLRHASFHFKKIEDFDAELEKLKSSQNTPLNKINEHITSHFILHQEQQRKDLEAINIENYMNQDQLESFIKLVNTEEKSLLIMPKFNKLLKRAKNVDQLGHTKDKSDDLNYSLIRPGNDTLNKNAAFHCSFVSLKMVYEQGFANWLTNQPVDTLNKWAEKAKKRTTQAAREIKKDNTLLARMERLRPLRKNINKKGEDETLLNYFSYLTQETASEFQVQENLYNNNPDKARKQSNFIEEYKQDILTIAFPVYLTENQLDFLLDGEQMSPIQPPNHPAELSEVDFSTGSEELERPWLYLLLHLMPAEFINHLSLQIRKHNTLTEGKEEYQKIQKAINLYLKVRENILETKSLEDDVNLSKFYEKSEVFNRQFTQNTDDDRLIPVRGLREILRFGSIKQLLELFEENKVKPDELNTYNQIKTQIADKQKERTKLHEELTGNVKDNYQKKLNSYKDLVESIEKHRELRNKIYLHDPKQAHQLIMSILGRLVGFSQLWERDLYFTMLSLLLLRQVDDYNKNNDFIDFVENGRIADAIECMQKAGADEDKEKRSRIKADLKKIFIFSDNDERTLKQIRNDLAHFNTLHTTDKINFTDLINETRKLVAYDRKLKNAVSKSIIELMQRNNFEIKFKITDENGSHKLKCQSLFAKPIKHLKKNFIQEKSQSDNYTKTIARLFGDHIKTKKEKPKGKKPYKGNHNRGKRNN